MPEKDLITYTVQRDDAGTVATVRLERAQCHKSASSAFSSGKPGFVTMNLHASIDGHRIAVYAQWASHEALQAAFNDPAAIAAHERMEKIGSFASAPSTASGSRPPASRATSPSGDDRCSC